MSDIPNLPQTRSSGDEVVTLPVQRQPTVAKQFEPPISHELPGADAELNLRDYWHVITHRKWTVLVFFLVVVITTVVASFLATPIYRSSLTLQIERELPKVVKFQDVVPVESAMDKDFYQTQYELLKSRTLAKRVIDHLALATHSAFNSTESSNWQGWIRSILAAAPGVGEESHTSAVRRDELVEEFLDNLSIEPVKQSRLVRVSFESKDAELAARVLNALAENFIQMNLERRVDASSYAKSFLEDRLTQVKAKLEDSEKKLVAFAREHEIIKVDTNRSVQLQKLNEASRALATAERERIEAEALYNETMATQGHGLSQVLDSIVIQKLKQTEAEMEASYQEKLNIFKPAYPSMLQLKQQIDEIAEQIEEEVTNIRAAIRSQYQMAKLKERALANKVGTLKSEVLSIQDSSIPYNILQREVDTNRELYEGLLQRMKEVGVAGGVTTNNVSVVDGAEVPYKKHKPRIAVNALLALIIGVVGGIGLAFLFEHLDDTLKEPEVLERRLQLPVLGVVPEVKMLKSHLADPLRIAKLAFNEPRSGLAEAYRSVRTSLLFSTSRGAPNIMLFTSPGPGEGKTTSALNVAITFTQTGNKVLLIDTDLRNPSLHSLLQLNNMMGLTNYLAGDAQPVEISQHTNITNLFVIPSGPLPPNPAELLSSDKMADLLELAADKFDYVILDGPPILGLADALVLANIAQGTVVVAEAGVTRLGHLQGALKRMRSAHANIVGSVMAKYKESSNAYGYHHYYYYQSDDSGRVRKLPT